MADNIDVTPGTGKTVAADEISSVLHQRVKLSLGADGSAVDAIAGAGNVSTAVQRVTLATDDAVGAAIVAAIGGVETAITGGTLTSGTAGTASSQVMTVQGIASMTPVLATLSGTNNIATVTAVTAITNALPAGTNAIGKLAANSGVDIGDVDVTSLPALPAGTNTIGNVIPAGVEYETVAASQTAQALGATGATGDLINGILVIPATTSPGNVLLLDNATSITVFAGGASSVSNLVPFFIPLGIKSVSGAWKITTGTNVSCIGVGDFT